MNEEIKTSGKTKRTDFQYVYVCVCMCLDRGANVVKKKLPILVNGKGHLLNYSFNFSVVLKFPQIRSWR